MQKNEFLFIIKLQKRSESNEKVTPDSQYGKLSILQKERSNRRCWIIRVNNSPRCWMKNIEGCFLSRVAMESGSRDRHVAERSALGSPFGRAGCPVRGSLRGSHVPIGAAQPSNGVPSQSACSADSSPIGRAKGAVSAGAHRPVTQEKKEYLMISPGFGACYRQRNCV